VCLPRSGTIARPGQTHRSAPTQSRRRSRSWCAAHIDSAAGESHVIASLTGETYSLQRRREEKTRSACRRDLLKLKVFLRQSGVGEKGGTGAGARRTFIAFPDPDTLSPISMSRTSNCGVTSASYAAGFYFVSLDPYRASVLTRSRYLSL
jgi:hypothetical protein